MIIPETVLTILGIAGICALAGIIGTMVDTRTKGGLKGFLVLVILGALAAVGYKAYQLDRLAKSESKRADEALRMAKETGRIAGDDLVKHELFRQTAMSDKEELIADREKRAAVTRVVTDQLIGILEKVRELEDAAEKARKKEIAESAETVQLETSKALFALALEQGWLGAVEAAKMEKALKKDKPLKEKDIALIAEKLTADLEKIPVEPPTAP